MAVTLPGTSLKTNVDSATDDPKLARADILDLMQKYDTLIGMINALGITQLGDGIELEAQTAGTKDKVRVKLDGSSLARSAAGMKIADNGVSGVMLANGSASPGASKYYGTNASSVFGFHSVPVGILLQRIHVSSTTYSTFTTNTVIPRDNTAPLNTEGNEVFSQAITLANASNKVVLSGRANVACSTARTHQLALFRGSTCIWAYGEYTGGSEEVALDFEFQDSPGSTGPHTYSVRVGVDAAVTQYFNGNSSGAIFGGTYRSHLTLLEFA